MPVRQEFESQEAIPEFLKNAVVEQDGKWIFEAETAAEVGNLKNTLKKERDGRTKYEAELKRFERFKPLTEAEEDEVAEFFDRWEKRNDPPKGAKGADPTKEIELKDKIHQREIKKRDDELNKIRADFEKAQSELKDFKLWTPLRDIALKAGLDPGDWEVARLELSNQGRFGFDDDGKVVVIEDGSPSTVSPEKFFRDVYSEARPKFYRATGAGGSGAQNGNNGAGGRGITLSREQAKDPAVYRAAKEKAAKAGVEFTVSD